MGPPDDATIQNVSRQPIAGAGMEFPTNVRCHTLGPRASLTGVAPPVNLCGHE